MQSKYTVNNPNQQDNHKPCFSEIPLPPTPHYHAITHFVIFFAALKLSSLLTFSSYYTIDNIVPMNAKSKNNHKKPNLHDIHYTVFLPPPQHISNLSYSSPPLLDNTITITIPTAPIPPLPIHPPSDKNTKSIRFSQYF